MRRLLVFSLLTAACWVVLSWNATNTPGGGRAFAFAADNETEGEGGAGEAEHPEEGVPGFQRDLALWSLVVFILFVAVLGKFAWKPLVDALNERESRVRQDIAGAESARVKAEQMLAEHQQKLDAVQGEVKEILTEARRDAEKAGERIIADAQQQAEDTKNRAIAEIEQSKDLALQELFDAMAGQVATATEYVLGHGLNADDQDRLIQEALAELAGGQSSVR